MQSATVCVFGTLKQQSRGIIPRLCCLSYCLAIYGLVNVAPTLSFVVIDTVHDSGLLASGVQLDVHPANEDPVAGVAISVTVDPCAKFCEQVVPPLPQSIKAAEPAAVVIVPVPVPTS